MSDMREIAEKSNAWPYVEARAILKRLNGKTPEKGYVLFQTGYGPSGLPHIGTFGEVARTSWVRHAFQHLSDIPTKLFAFSDDMDGFRSVPDNVPNKELLSKYVQHKSEQDIVIRNGSPLTSVPDPFETHDSFGAHNNERLQKFLDAFGFDYEFKSATACYQSGMFNDVILKILENHNKIREIVAPNLSAEKAAEYSPLLPIRDLPDEMSGGNRRQVVHNAQILEADVKSGIVRFRGRNVETGDVEEFEQSVLDGHCKMQWRVDWAMRWTALDVDYEMYGKDLIDSCALAGKIARVIGGKPPAGFSYELFLDENGEKISKSKGNGLTVDEWLRYAPPESLAYFMYQKPKTAKRLYFDVIPRQVDEYSRMLDAYEGQDAAKQADNPVSFIHMGTPPTERAHLSFNILLNLASVCHTEDKSVLWHFISRYRPDANPETAPMLDRLVEYAINYYQDFVRPNKAYRKATDDERAALEDLAARLRALSGDADAETIQTEVYEVSKRENFEDQKACFKALYEILLGQSQGPRLGSFIALYGLDESLALIDRAIRGEDMAA